MYSSITLFLSEHSCLVQGNKEANEECFRAKGLVKLRVAPPSPSDGSAQILNQSTLKPESSKRSQEY